MEKYTLLVIGGSGFLSGTLAQVALAQGHRVWVVTRGIRPVPPGAIPLTIDRLDRESFSRLIAEQQVYWDAVIDCIGYEPEDAIQDIEVFSTLAGHLIFVSTDFVYDPAARRFPQNEDGAAYLSSGYGGKKRRCEELFIETASSLAWSVLRPGHIYGPGSALGCLPEHSRDENLIAHLRGRKPLRLVGGGHFLQQPIYAPDLSQLILSLVGNERCFRQVFCAAGPDVIESRRYYEIIGDILGLPVHIEETPVQAALQAHPEWLPFLCHRFYDLRKLRGACVEMPATPIEIGLAEQVHSLLNRRDV
ncbi:NAD-dependent epimerase/dehydratase family protein [candidate division KSB1 bacterium]|nr:NAD-dependent epimerase/dehydratase family protein [candidate division KSB1 bacterium]